MSSPPDHLPPDWSLSGSMCRVCLRSDPAASWSLFECTVAGKSLVQALSLVGGIQVQTGDNFPKSCCSNCLARVEAALKLREQCLESDRRLGVMFAVTVKNEPPEEEEEEEDPFVACSQGYFEPARAEEHSVASVLQHFGLDGFLAIVEGQDLESVELFSCLLEQDLQKMLPNETVGTIIRFRKAVAHAKQLLAKSSSDERKAKHVEPEPIPRKKRRIERPLLEHPVIVANPNQDHVNLPALLQTFEGQCIMTHYVRNGNQLDNQTQGKLLKLIVEQLAVTVRIQDIQRSWFEAIFAAIVEAFPSESELIEVYRGKLQQIRYKLTRKIKRNSGFEVAEQGNGVAVNGEEEPLIDEDEAIASKLWLQGGREPWKSVLLHWDKSFQLRNKIYQSSGSNKLGELWRDDGWPILKQPNGLDLIRRDFNRMFSPSSDVFQVWPRIKKAVCTFGRLNLKNKNLLAVLAKFEEGGYTDDHLFIQLLAGLLPPGITTRKFRPKFEEINAAFMREVASLAEVDKALAKYRTALAEHKLSVQPHVLHIADQSRYLVYVGEGRYYEARGGLLDAVDGVLKVCLVTGQAFTAEAKPMWTFVQRFCYGVKTDSDNSYACLRSLQAFLRQAQERE
ncbi:uncharacterized protein LOC120427665 [Culex pipiens pallens]|uniref:uncharacterized protein LOC120427665 n=1 Tax=Culex pipiens pallens TaxID=42434 RepID=UPI0022AB1F3C|nr:uncharacterized protein LOC120427665 [Culex pipiens pallens]